MKTLDEVINAFEICIGYYCSNADHDVCPYFGESDMGCMKEPEKDALHYLKEYRNYLDTLCALPDYYEWIHSADNPPLTWDELKTMEGKPVWVEYDDHFPGRKRTKFKEWEVINCILDDRLIVKGDWDYHKNELGEIWQAYRKERG